MEADDLIELNDLLDNGEPCSFIRMEEDTRLAALLHHFSQSGELLPEISLKDLAIEPEEATL